ncbi:MAG: fasciclin domain-containing protein, partial [Pseudomonadota bacterium]
GLAGALDDPEADLTVFAPTDAAFVGLAQTLGFTGTDEGAAFSYIVTSLTLLSGGGDPIPLLTDILLYHVAPGTLDADAVLAAETLPTLLNVDLGVDGLNLVDRDPDIADPEIIATNLAASNGIAHAIDGVLIPVDLLTGDGSRASVDFKIGDDGNEVFRTGGNTDFVAGEGGHDRIYLGRGDDVGLGGEGDDRLFGGSGNDRLDGGAGHDVLNGGRGNDALVGGEDADRFVFNGRSGADVIEDFTVGEDVIALRIHGVNDFDDLEGHISDTDAGAVIELAHTRITLEGVEARALTEADFLFH